MKKLICFLAFTSLFAVSCSSDSDDNTDNPDNPNIPSNRLIQEIDTYEDGSSTTYTFTYSGDKIASVIDSDGGIMNVTYTGERITEIEYFTGSTLDQTDLFEYNSAGKLVTMVRLHHDVEWGDKYVYVHNSDNTITETEYSGDLESQTMLQATSTITLLANGEVGSMTSGGTSVTYEYDNKNNPWKNIPGMGELNYSDHEPSGVNHNVLSMEETGAFPLSATYTYTYNSDNYPVTSVETYDGEVISIEYIYAE